MRPTRLNPLVTKIEAENAAGGYSPETVGLLSRMTVRPNSSRCAAIDNLVVALKENGIWSKLDGLYLFAAHSQQAALLNWVRSTANFSAVNSPTFTVDVGFTGDGSTSSLTNSNAATVNAKALDLTTAVWVSKAPLAMAEPFTTWWTGWNWAFAPYQTATQCSWRLARTASNTTASSQTGFFTFNRTGANMSNLYRDGAKIGTDTNAYDSTGTYLSTNPIRLLSTNGTSQFSTTTVSAAAYGAALDDASMALFYNAMRDYMTAVNLSTKLGL